MNAEAFANDGSLGACYLGDGRCRFLVWAPHAHAVAVRIVHPDRRVAGLEKTPDGYHTGVLQNIAPGARYVYRLFFKSAPDEFQGTAEFPDPASRYQPEGVHGPSQVVDGHFNWQERHWHGIPLSRYIIYELHVGTFTGQGTFTAAVDELDRLKDLGVTAVELMPVSQFPGTRNWGYDGVYPFAPQNSYGGPAGLKHLIDACHQREMAVILDVVYNHLGPEGNYFKNFGPYFTQFYNTPWGEAVNFDGPFSDAVRRFFIENALYWIQEYRIDALRIDAVHSIFDFSAHPFLMELGEAVRSAAKRQNRHIYCIAESALNDVRVIGAKELGGWGLDAQWSDDFHHCLHTLLTKESSGYYADFGGTGQFAKAWQEGFVYSGQYSRFRKRRHGNSSRHIPARRFVVFSQNHDQVGNRMLGERLSTLVTFEQLKVAAAAVLLSPFIPLLFMGQEYGETAGFPYFVSHSDPDLVAAVRKGRKEEFSAFAWKDDPPDPQDEATFWRAKLTPELSRSGHHKTLLQFYRELVSVRKKYPSISTLSKKRMTVCAGEQQKSLCIHRWCTGEDVCIWFNFAETASRFAADLPQGLWKKIVDSSDAKWHGPGGVCPEHIESNGHWDMTLPPLSAAVYLRKHTRPSL